MRVVSAVILFILVTSTLSSSSVAMTEPVDYQPWWETTSMDEDRDGIHDAIWIAIASELHDWVDDDDTISVIVDFDHQPSAHDQEMLEGEVGFQTQFRYHLIHSIAGRVAVDELVRLADLPGVVMVELDGILTVQMNDVNAVSYTHLTLPTKA